MEPSPVAVGSTVTASDLALKSKSALLEAVEDVTYGSVSEHAQLYICDD
jgi:hypothetical protein